MQPLKDITQQALNAEISIKSNSSTSSTEEMLEDNQHEWEELVRKETQAWLDEHGTKLFALESSKFLVKEARKKNLRSVR